MCYRNRLYTFERPLNSGPFPVSRCPLTVVRLFPRPRWLSPFVPVRRRSKLVGCLLAVLVGWLLTVLVGWLD